MNRRILLAFILAGVGLIAALVIYFISRQIPMSPYNSGNTAGNMLNGGLFFEMNGKVYFANSSDGNCLYSMNVDESGPKQLTSMGVKYISGADGYLYFYMDSTHESSNVKGLGTVSNQYGIYRCKINGSAQTCLVRDFCGEVQLCGEYLYYQVKAENGSLHKMKCDKTDRKQVAPELISPICYEDGTIYYTGVTSDHNIHTIRTRNNDTVGTLVTGNFFNPVVMDGYLYYMNGEDNYSLWRFNLLTGESSIVTQDRVDYYTVDHRHIYYAFSDPDTPALKMCDVNGDNSTVLFPGVVNSINVTSRNVYFKVFGDEQTTYHMPLDGSIPASPFVVEAR
ncbi:MAG: DUF5050 domain-containing protein [Butyrivibrio sp.]|nr:DUF5050 domain-containing protein [Butyrivibrio sp.]